MKDFSESKHTSYGLKKQYLFAAAITLE